MFKRFFSTKGSEGTGIGLMITKKIIDEHKGVIKVESKEGAGSKFFIKLPKKPDG
ncbi:MAG: ATP-binding protein [Desulfobacteraceae bacterium]|nr:ATP-binding protein [Desulfobacteraceae bacterium]